jgi:hypothetical protein
MPARLGASKKQAHRLASVHCAQERRNLSASGPHAAPVAGGQQPPILQIDEIHLFDLQSGLRWQLGRQARSAAMEILSNDDASSRIKGVDHRRVNVRK